MAFQIETPTPYRLCLVCRRRLNRVRHAIPLEAGGTWRFATWEHGGFTAEKHDPIPVLEDDKHRPVFVCDICSSEEIAWLVGAEGFEMPVSALHAHSESHWMLCQPCFEAFEARDVNSLGDRAIARVKRGDPRATPYDLQQIRARIRPLHLKLIAGSTGDNKPITQETAWGLAR